MSRETSNHAINLWPAKVFEVTKKQLEAFLDDAGVVRSAPDEGDASAIDFKNRGTSIRAFAYEDGDLLHLTCSYKMPPRVPSPEKVRSILDALQDEFPVVKLSTIGSGDHSGFTVAAEQFEPDVANISGVFWKTADLIVSVADECYRRLEAQPEEAAASQAGADEWLAGLEAALEKGSQRSTSATGGGESDSVYAGLKSSLALVVTADRSTGTAFCFASDSQSSHYVTNAHVVGEDTTLRIYRQRPHFEKMDAVVVAKGSEGTDLAVLRVGSPNIAALKLADRSPMEESAVGLAGYARAHIWAAQEFGEIVPSIRLGTVTGVLKDGSCVLHDVLCRPGDSGGPLFDPLSRAVVGLQSGGWQDEEEGYAIGASVVADFLKANKTAAS